MMLIHEFLNDLFSTSLSVNNPDCAGPVANSSIDNSGKRTREMAFPKTDLWLSGVTGNCCLTHSASDHLEFHLKRCNERYRKVDLLYY